MQVISAYTTSLHASPNGGFGIWMLTLLLMTKFIGGCRSTGNHCMSFEIGGNLHFTWWRALISGRSTRWLRFNVFIWFFTLFISPRWLVFTTIRTMLDSNIIILVIITFALLLSTMLFISTLVIRWWSCTRGCNMMFLLIFFVGGHSFNLCASLATLLQSPIYILVYFTTELEEGFSLPFAYD